MKPRKSSVATFRQQFGPEEDKPMLMSMSVQYKRTDEFSLDGSQPTALSAGLKQETVSPGVEQAGPALKMG